jgi:hypothetical protein
MENGFILESFLKSALSYFGSGRLFLGGCIFTSRLNRKPGQNYNPRTSVIRILLFALLLSASSANAQRPNFFSGTFQTEHNITGIRYVSGTPLSNTLLVGTMVGLTKVEGMKSVMMPFGAHFSLGFFSKTVYPLLVVEPGYNLYSAKTESMGSSYNTRGGFTFYGGGGMGFKMGDKAALNFIAGYSLYRFRANKVRSTLEGIGFRLTGIVF